MSRIASTAQDLVGLGCRKYCDLGPGKGAIAKKLREAGKEVIGVEAPWANPNDFPWASQIGVKLYYEEFFTGDFSKVDTDVDCYILAHCIAHFRFSPYILFKKIHDALPSGGYFYLSTVNGASFERVAQLFKGQPIVERVSHRLTKKAQEISADWNRTGMPHIWDDWMHVKEYTLGEVRTLFTDSGFTVVRASYRNNYPGMGGGRWKKNLVLRFLPRMADELVVIGRKP